MSAATTSVQSESLLATNSASSTTNSSPLTSKVPDDYQHMDNTKNYKTIHTSGADVFLGDIELGISASVPPVYCIVIL